MVRLCDKRIAQSDYDALLFDLDGVVTSTAELHAEAWKRLFDEFLETYSESVPADRSPFTLPRDYLDHIDGKPRIDGVRDFLISRGINLPEGADRDSPTQETVNGLGARKDGYYHQLIKRRGVKVFDSTVTLVRQSKALGFKTAIASSSKNCSEILEATGLSSLFDARFDGNDLEKQNIPGKPNPGMFLAAACLLGVDPDRTVVFEDAVSGVEAGKRGGFGLVVGVGCGEHGEELALHGADVVVKDLGELELVADDG